MKVALFIPCYVDQLYPQVGLATVRVLEHLGVDAEFPEAQTCCGQPMSNAGVSAAAAPLAHKFLDVFHRYDAIVCPSGSCTSMVRNHYAPLVGDRPEYAEVRRHTYELCEFVHDVLGVKALRGRYPRKVGLHRSCHGLRELRLGSPSERMEPRWDKVGALLSSLEGIELVTLQRQDECCGFGGTFAVVEEAMSVMMGKDRLQDHVAAGAEVITGTDVSCLMHLDGLARRQGTKVSFRHVAEVLAEALP
jgi:L-lactate dehydrogenase complex protein LldE